MITFAVDFDGTLTDSTKDVLVLHSRAIEGLMALKAAGHRLILWSCRCNPMDPGPTPPDAVYNFYCDGIADPRIAPQWERFNEMRRALKAAKAWELFDDIWQAPGKPLADMYIDDKSETPQWDRIIYEFGASQ